MKEHKLAAYFHNGIYRRIVEVFNFLAFNEIVNAIFNVQEVVSGRLFDDVPEQYMDDER